MTTKKLLFAAYILCVISTNAQSLKETDSIEVTIVNLPDSGSSGTPIGKKTMKEIGIEGGKIISDDGKLELVFPAGALTKTTEISIQPISNVIPNGNKCYQLEPSGIQFKKPVQIIFRYTDDEAEVCSPDLKFMSLQDHNGKWEYMAYDEWDSTNKVLKGSISHFSTFVDGNLVELGPTELETKVGKTHLLTLHIVQTPAPPTPPGEDPLPPLPIAINKGRRLAVWKINSTVGGNEKTRYCQGFKQSINLGQLYGP